MSRYNWASDERITEVLMDEMLYQNADGESADMLTKLSVADASGAGTEALEIRVQENLTADEILDLVVNDTSRSIDLTGNITIGGNLTTFGAFTTTVGPVQLVADGVGGSDVTLPATGTLVTLAGVEILTNKTLTAPGITGGTAIELTGLSIRSTGGNDLLFATAVVFGADRTLNLTIPDADTALTLTADLIRVGAHSLTITTTGVTTVTLPTAGTLITNAVTALAGLITVGTIGTGTWEADAVTVPYGGSGLATITDHSVMLGSGVGAVTPLVVGTTGKVLRGLTAGDPTWSTFTIADAFAINTMIYASAGDTLTAIAAATSSVLVTDGADIPAFATDIPTAVTIGGAYVYRAGGTDVAMADGGAAAALVASNGGIVYSTAAALAVLAAAAGAGPLLRAGGAGAPTWTTSTYPATNAINTLLYASGANAMAALATGASGVLVTSAGSVPSIATDIPTGVTIGAAYVYRVGGTDVAVADGGTNISAYTIGDILEASGAAAITPITAVAVGQVLCSGGVATVSAWSATPTFTSSVQTGRGEVGYVNLKDDTTLTIDAANENITCTQSYHAVLNNAAAANDDLKGISGTQEGDIIIIFPGNAAQTVDARHAQAPGAGKQLNLAAGADFAMDEDDDFLMLLDDGTLMQEISRSENHA